MFYEKRTPKKERRQKGHEGRVEVFFKRVLVSRLEVRGRTESRRLSGQTFLFIQCKKKKHEDISMEIMISSKTKTKKHHLRVFTKSLNWTYSFIRIHNTVLQQWFSTPLCLLCGRQG